MGIGLQRKKKINIVFNLFAFYRGFFSFFGKPMKIMEKQVFVLLVS